MIIERQKEIADDLLYRLEQIDPYCILAGGAPRDWYNGNEANDLDFYIYGYEWPTHLILDRLARVGITGLKSLGGKPSEDNIYSTMKSLRAVFESTIAGIKVQIMIMNDPTFRSVVNSFGVTISKFWYKAGRISAEPEALMSIKYKVIGYRDDFSCKETYYNKMKERYKGYTFVKMSDFKDVIYKRVISETMLPLRG
jgi:hypothetical protein